MIFPESPPTAVTSAYAIPGAVWTPLGSGGGFSGSKVWRGVCADGAAYCLKAHPAGRGNRDTLEGTVHRWMKAADLPFVPRIVTSVRGQTAVEGEGRVWELTAWMPGHADFHLNPSDTRLAAAVTAVAELHRRWAGPGTLLQPIPGVARRLAALAHWCRLTGSGWRPDLATPHGPTRGPAERAWQLLPALVPDAIRLLEPVRSLRAPTHPCLCDVWHDHVLFTDDRVTGLIDFAAAKIDHPAVDLARLLGSLIPDDPDRTAFALGVYRRIAPLSHPQLVDLLDRTGTVVAATHWLRVLYLDRKVLSDPAAIARRLTLIVQRLVRWG